MRLSQPAVSLVSSSSPFRSIADRNAIMSRQQHRRYHRSAQVGMAACFSIEKSEHCMQFGEPLQSGTNRRLSRTWCGLNMALDTRAAPLELMLRWHWGDLIASSENATGPAIPPAKRD